MTIARNNHVFKGHKALMGNRYVTYGELELPTRYDQFPKSKDGFDWGTNGSGSQQLAYSILRQLTDEEFSKEYAAHFARDVVFSLNSRDWVLSANDVADWINKNTDYNEREQNVSQNAEMKTNLPLKTHKKQKKNVVKDVCIELGITQKELAAILEVPEGTISSWAVKNEIPRLGKKAIEFYILNSKNQKIVDSYKEFVGLIKNS